MRMENIKHELKKILLVVRTSGMQKAIQELIDKAEKPNVYVKLIPSGKWVYFYLELSKYDPKTQKTGWLGRENLGKMELAKFNNLDKKTLREMEINNLKKLLIKY